MKTDVHRRYWYGFGDLTIYGRRDNVMLIRDNEGQKEITRLNLDSSKVLVRLILPSPQ